MTRKSKRSLERDIEKLKENDRPYDPLVVFEDPDTGKWSDGNGLIADSSEVDPLVIIPVSDSAL